MPALSHPPRFALSPPSHTLPPLDAAAPTKRPITDRMVETVLIQAILQLEEDLIPAQGAGDVLYVYASDNEITHDVRRTLEIFGGDINEAVENICAFVVDGIVGDERTDA